jgi:methyltransferase
MVNSLDLYTDLLAVVGVERLVELRLSRRHAGRAFARGATEAGRAHYRVMVAFHVLFLAACVAEPRLLDRPFPGALGWIALAGVLVAQALRYWAIATLGERWNTRIIVLPDAAPVTGGPYRFLKHPNYLAVVAEVALLPLVHGAWLTALAFSLGNAAILAVRIRAEEAALGPRYAVAFAGKGRLIPEVPRE